MAAQLLQEQKQRVTRHHCRFHVGNLLKFMLVAIQLVYKGVLASAIWQNEPAIHIPPSSLDFLPTQVTTEPGVAFPFCSFLSLLTYLIQNIRSVCYDSSQPTPLSPPRVHICSFRRRLHFRFVNKTVCANVFQIPHVCVTRPYLFFSV